MFRKKTDLYRPFSSRNRTRNAANRRIHAILTQGNHRFPMGQLLLQPEISLRIADQQKYEKYECFIQIMNKSESQTAGRDLEGPLL